MYAYILLNSTIIPGILSLSTQLRILLSLPFQNIITREHVTETREFSRFQRSRWYIFLRSYGPMSNDDHDDGANPKIHLPVCEFENSLHPRHNHHDETVSALPHLPHLILYFTKLDSAEVKT